MTNVDLWPATKHFRVAYHLREALTNDVSSCSLRRARYNGHIFDASTLCLHSRGQAEDTESPRQVAKRNEGGNHDAKHVRYGPDGIEPE